MTSEQQRYRIEHDTMGEVRVPADARWGAQTQRAVENFPISGQRLERRLIRALALIKGEAAHVNAALGVIDPGVADAVATAAVEVSDGRWDDQFPIDVFQTGSGTSSNMNMNEVLASLAAERLGQPVHPNDQVNASQSSNDVFPSAIHVAAVDAVVADLRPALRHLEEGLRSKAAEFATVVKAGRTHLMDATPVTLGQEFGGYAQQIHESIERLDSALPRVGRLPLGGTAVGTGINAPPAFAPAVIDRLAASTGLPLSEAPDHFAAQAARDGLVELSGHLRTLAVALLKIANDLRWMGSGPRAGLAEIRLPDLQPGSSIMPGKVNPVIPEAVSQVVAQVIGNDAAVAFAGSQGAFELNTYLPLMARDLLESIRLLSAVSRLFRDRCIDGIEADVERCRSYAEASLSVLTSLAPVIGYERAAALVKEAGKSGRPVRELVLETGLVGADELDRALDVLRLTTNQPV
ncbi:MAG: fumarate hydratase, class [Acidimicrobiia bacterium]|jgi:fumarate hydratase class II|nr:fumarate hydratase, class [Acidimicrobiia bacterium]